MVALGMMSKAPTPNMAFYTNLEERATSVLVDEYKTSLNCFCFLEATKKAKLHRLKVYKINASVRSVWNRDVNAINMINKMQWRVIYGDCPRDFARA